MPLREATSLRESARRTSLYVCWQCQQRRSITQNFLKKKEEGKQQWAEWAKEIRANKRKSMLTILKERGLVHAVAGDEKMVDRLMIDKRIGAYVGIDPTAPSLHVGHLLPLMALFWMHLHGFHTVSLLGASTARIGDPTGRTTDRPDMTPTERKANVASMHYQLKRLWVNLERVGAKHGYQYERHWHRELVNNAVWWNKLAFLDVLKILGRGTRLGTMLSRDTVKTKMESGDGMSFAEFCYPLMQAWDWWHMYEEKGIQMQIGGSDQYGNIVAGMDAIKYIAKSHPDPDIRQQGGVQEATTPYGFTVPLLTTAAGAKFGKSAGNAVWLDQSMTSLFDLYGFFVRTADADVERYLKLFSFLSLAEIQSLMDQHKNDPSKRIPQHRLAREFVDLIHGEEAARSTEEQHRAVFQKTSLSSISTQAKAPKPNPLASNQDPGTRLLATFANSNLNKYAPQSNANNSQAEHTILPKSLVHNQPIARVLWAAGLVSSRSEGHRLVENHGAYIGMRSSGKEQMKDDLSFTPAKLRDPAQSWNNVIRDEASSGAMEKEGEEGLLILRVGKWKVRVVRIVSDKKFEELGIEGPQAWQEFKASATANKQRENYEALHKANSGSTAGEHARENEPELEAITAEDNAKLRAELADVPNPAEGRLYKESASSRKEQWEALRSQHHQGRQDYITRSKEDMRRVGRELKAAGLPQNEMRASTMNELRDGLDEIRAHNFHEKKPRPRLGRGFGTPMAMAYERLGRSFESPKGTAYNRRAQDTHNSPSSSSSEEPAGQGFIRRVQYGSTGPNAGRFVPEILRRVQGDSTLPPSTSPSSDESTSERTYPPVGRLAALQTAAQKQILKDGVKGFGSKVKAGMRKPPSRATLRTAVLNRRGSLREARKAFK